MKNTISNFIEKIKYLERTLEALKTLKESRKQIQENNKKKIEKVIETILVEKNIKIEENKNYMIEKINIEFGKIENKLSELLKNKKEVNNEIYQQIEKLKNIAQNEIPRLYSESNDLNSKNNNNINLMKNILNEEVNYTKNLIISNSQKIKENEDNFGQSINNQLEIVYKSLYNVKNTRKKNEEELLEQITEFIKKIKNAISK